MKKSSKVKKAVAAAGGAKKAALAVFKKAYQSLRSKLPGFVRGRLPSKKLSKKEAVAASALWGFVVNNI